MTSPPLAVLPGAWLQDLPLRLMAAVSDWELVYIAAGLVVFVLFLIAARVASGIVVDALRKREMRTEMLVVGRRVITFVLIGFGVLAAMAFAFQSANVAIVGIVLATIIASFGVQDLLKDYVSGYYLLVERHIRVGDPITLENGFGSGTVTEVKLRVTLLRNESGDLVVVPNSELFNKAVTVHVRADKRAAETKAETKPETKTEPPA
jgi:small conductance mechanosensitive channel